MWRSFFRRLYLQGLKLLKANAGGLTVQLQHRYSGLTVPVGLHLYSSTRVGLQYRYSGLTVQWAYSRVG